MLLIEHSGNENILGQRLLGSIWVLLDMDKFFKGLHLFQRIAEIFTLVIELGIWVIHGSRLTSGIHLGLGEFTGLGIEKRNFSLVVEILGEFFEVDI